MPNETERILVVGAGLMGSGIGQAFAQAGHRVVLYDRTNDQLRTAVSQIKENLKEMLQWHVIDAARAKETLQNIQTSLSLEQSAEGVEFVAEAIDEDLAAKQGIFQRLDRICPSQTLLASNTSFFKPSALSVGTYHPERILVAHFFYPPHLIPLVEIVPSPQTLESAGETAYRLIKAIGKVPILVRKEAVGFVANRLQLALMREALHIVDEGIASPEDVDLAVKSSFGRRLAVAGPLELREIQSGWDSTLATSGSLFRELCSSSSLSPFVKERVAKGELGSKTGKGIYSWSPEEVTAWKKRMSENLIHFMVCDSEKS